MFSNIDLYLSLVLVFILIRSINTQDQYILHIRLFYIILISFIFGVEHSYNKRLQDYLLSFITVYFNVTLLVAFLCLMCF